MVTTREMLEAIKEDCGASGASVKVGIDAYKTYEDLRNATPAELLDAVIWFYRQESTISAAEAEGIVSFLRIGWELAQPGGWAHVAPMWLRESRKLAALDG